MFATARHLLDRFGRWPRYALAGICVLLAVASAARAHQTKRSNAAQAPVAVAAHPLAAGHTLTAGDLRIARWPTGLRPPGAQTAIRPLVGERLAGPLARDEPVTARRLVGSDLTTGLPAGTVATTIEVEDPAIAHLVHPGDRVEVVATSPGAGPAAAGSTVSEPATTVAARALVLAVVEPAVGDASLAAAGTPAQVALVLATDRDTALRIAGLRTSRTFAVVGDSP